MEKQNAYINNVEGNNGGHFEQGKENSEVVNEPITFENLEAAKNRKIKGQDKMVPGKLGALVASPDDYGKFPSKFIYFRWVRTPQRLQENLHIPGVSMEEFGPALQKHCQDLMTGKQAPLLFHELGAIDADPALSAKEVDIRPGVKNGGDFEDKDLEWSDESGTPIPHSDLGPLGDHRANP